MGSFSQVKRVINYIRGSDGWVKCVIIYIRGSIGRVKCVIGFIYRGICSCKVLHSPLLGGEVCWSFELLLRWITGAYARPRSTLKRQGLSTGNILEHG